MQSVEQQDLKSQVHHVEAIVDRGEHAAKMELNLTSSKDATADTQTNAKSGVNRHTILAFIVSVRTLGDKRRSLIYQRPFLVN